MTDKTDKEFELTQAVVAAAKTCIARYFDYPSCALLDRAVKQLQKWENDNEYF